MWMKADVGTAAIPQTTFAGKIKVHLDNFNLLHRVLLMARQRNRRRRLEDLAEKTDTYTYTLIHFCPEDSDVDNTQ